MDFMMERKHTKWYMERFNGCFERCECELDPEVWMTYIRDRSACEDIVLYSNVHDDSVEYGFLRVYLVTLGGVTEAEEPDSSDEEGKEKPSRIHQSLLFKLFHKLDDEEHNESVKCDRPIREELAKAAKYLWSQHKGGDTRPDDYDRFENKDARSKYLRTVLGIKDGCDCGFQECRVEIYEPHGDIIYDTTVGRGRDAQMDRYRWLTMMTTAFRRREDRQLYYLYLKFFHDEDPPP